MGKGLIHHMEMNVSDLSKSTDFWGWLLEELGYHLFQKWDAGRSWKLNDSYLVFVQTEEKYLPSSYYRKRVGLNHLAFHAESSAQVDALTKRLQQKGIPILYSDKHPYAGGINHYAVYFEDPDRIKVEIVAPKL
ncbi:VOC family protein [Oceanobacillus saliphilus]|uniref:VOC family protein n=1 Tax=Oceanobacillus saliphilus TaxID=2925834 RepID=UPI00201DCD10|nr:VOC family protein [Oceanobacillus saliphilus]